MSLHLSCDREMPSLLQSMSYIFCFHGLMCGPFCFYKDYIAFIEGTNYKSVKAVQVSCMKVVVVVLVVVTVGVCYITISIHDTCLCCFWHCIDCHLFVNLKSYIVS